MTHFPYEAVSVSLSKTYKKSNWIQSTSAHGIGSLCRCSEKHIPTVLQGNHRNCCYQSTVSHPSEGIWQHMWGTNFWKGTLYCFQKQSRLNSHSLYRRWGKLICGPEDSWPAVCRRLHNLRLLSKYLEQLFEVLFERGEEVSPADKAQMLEYTYCSINKEPLQDHYKGRVEGFARGGRH